MATVPSQDLPAEPTGDSAEAKQYHRHKLTGSILSLILTLVALAIMAFGFGPTLAHALPAWVLDNRWLELVVLAGIYAAGLELLTLPIDFWSGFILEHRYQLSNQSLPRWIWRRVKGYLVGGPLGLAMLLGLYALLWFSGAWWWLWAAVAYLAVTLVLGQLVPVLILPLFYKVTRLDDTGLLERLRSLAHGTGLKVEGIYRLHLSADTRKANAALAGLGRTRRVLLGDTLLDQFTPEEIEVVFAHEVGHHVYRHLPKLVAWNVILVGVGLWVVDQILHVAAAGLGYSRFDSPAALPLLMIVLAAFGLILSPAQNALSRFFERQCDRYALQRTRMPDVYRSAFRKLALVNKADMDPHPLVVWLFDDHPPIRERLAMADTPVG
ncbi:MAG TPA: M48 family metallopeptidase [Gemmataceae bacterium]|nr:M48 family metallopeptidase [Gemmataceae bacterium]